jgi:hypothetical protein
MILFFIEMKIMKRFKRILRLCYLILFMLLAATGIGILGVAPILPKDRKLIPGIERRIEDDENKNAEIPLENPFKY